MKNKKGTILIRFPDELADKLRRVSFEVNVPIKDIVSEIVSENLDAWFGVRVYETYDGLVESTEKIKKILGRQPDHEFVNKLLKNVENLEKSHKQLRKAAEMVSHGVLPIEMLLTEGDDLASSEPPKASRPASSQKEPAQQAQPSAGRSKKKAP
jgi:hypothetical protein